MIRFDDTNPLAMLFAILLMYGSKVLAVLAMLIALWTAWLLFRHQPITHWQAFVSGAGIIIAGGWIYQRCNK